MKNETFNQIIDEVYKHYQETHEYEPFILADEMGLTKEDFVKKATNNYSFGFLFGITLNERELSLEERFELAVSEKYKITHELDLINGKIPKRAITLFYKGEEIEIYE